MMFYIERYNFYFVPTVKRMDGVSALRYCAGVEASVGECYLSLQVLLLIQWFIKNKLFLCKRNVLSQKELYRFNTSRRQEPTIANVGSFENQII